MKNLILAAGLIAIAGCSINPYTGEEKVSNTGKGAGIGAFTGAVIGAATSGNDNRGEAILIGAAAGAAAGGGIGYYMDKQEAELRRKLEGTGVRVQRNGDHIRLVMPGNVTFDSNQYRVKQQFQPTLDSVVLVVQEFDKTAIKVVGHTDSTGSFALNQDLSERRASSVADYLAGQGVSYGRLQTSGSGPRQPIASNDSPYGRDQNRRVELDLIAL
jgi:outer membrane protein OmpA-like peptidoglycan-associated protein